MGSLLSLVVSALSQEIVNKIKSLGYHKYDIDIDNNFTVEGIRSNPKCRAFVKKSSICAEDLFTIEKATIDGINRVWVELKIPKVIIKIGKAGFTCSDPEFTCAVKGWIEIVDTHITFVVGANMENGIKLDQITIKPKVTEIKSEIQLAINKQDCSKAANSVLRSQDPTVINFILDFIARHQEESIKEFINNQLQEMQTRQTAEMF